MRYGGRYIPALLAALLLLTLPVSAGDGEKKFTIVNYNVAGLPKIFGNKAEDIPANQRAIGEILAERGFDIVAVQEDFGYHDHLASELDGYSHTTQHTGAVPGGDGMNVWSRFPLYNEERTAWETAYGIIEDGADEMTPKGILYTLVELEPGIYVDLYDIHADAYGDAGSVSARKEQFLQLARVIAERGGDRAVIVTGDFNISLHHGEDSGLWENFMKPLGFSDVWVTLCNEGNHADFSAWQDSGERWDSIEKILWRDGAGVTLTPVSFGYEDFTGEDGVSLSDHPAAVGEFSYTVDGTYVPEEVETAVPERGFWAGLWNKIRYIASDLWKIFANFEQLRSYITGE